LFFSAVAILDLADRELGNERRMAREDAQITVLSGVTISS